MKRIHLVELEDLPWFPDSLRRCMTLYIVAFHRMVGSDRLLAPLLAKTMKSLRINRIVDLCSGGGGPMPSIVRRLVEDHGMKPDVTLTDLYPNREAAEAVNAGGDGSITYRMTPVDAGNVPQDLVGLRTMIASFHHMPPPVARKILADAFAQRQPICIFEVSDNAPPIWLWWAPLLVGPLMVLLLTPWIRPLSLKQIILTYLIPILPFLIAWDGAVSNARVYTAADLKELLDGLEAPDYRWETGAFTKPRYPAKLPYLLGAPVRS